jgi:hypothetical protein
MNTKILIFVFILFIIYLACKKKIIKGGDLLKNFDGFYELASGPITNNDFAEITIGQDWAEIDNQGKGYIWINADNKKWFIDKNLMAKTDYPSEMRIDKIKLIEDDNNKIIGLINSDGRKFNKIIY